MQDAAHARGVELLIHQIASAQEITAVIDAANRRAGWRRAYVDFVTAHDGVTIADLVSYHPSWNCGVEGPTGDPTITPPQSPSVSDSCAALVMCISTDFSEPETEVWNYPRTIASPEISMEADSRPAAAIVDAQAGGVPCCGCRLRENQNDPGLADAGWSLSAMVPEGPRSHPPTHIGADHG